MARLGEDLQVSLAPGDTDGLDTSPACPICMSIRAMA
jgi:hypothetical protein